MAWTLALSGAAALAAGALFARVGLSLAARPAASPSDRAALRWFAAWWLAFAASTVAVGCMSFAGLLASPPAMLVAGLRIASLVFLSIGLWGLLSHLVYLYTGKDRSRPLAWAYAILGTLVSAYVLWTKPIGAVVTGWTVEVAGARPSPLGQGLLVLAFLVPPLAAGAAYLRLAQRVDDPRQRRRVRVVGGGIALWVVAHLLARASEIALWQFGTRIVLGVAVAAAIAWEYSDRPPQAETNEASAAFQERLRALV